MFLKNVMSIQRYAQTRMKLHTAASSSCQASLFTILLHLFLKLSPLRCRIVQYILQPALLLASSSCLYYLDQHGLQLIR